MEQKNDTGASKYRKPKITQTGPTMKMGGITGLGRIKNQLTKTRNTAMGKLESGRTLDYNPDSLERMNPVRCSLFASLLPLFSSLLLTFLSCFAGAAEAYVRQIPAGCNGEA